MQVYKLPDGTPCIIRNGQAVPLQQVGVPSVAPVAAPAPLPQAVTFQAALTPQVRVARTAPPRKAVKPRAVPKPATRKPQPKKPVERVATPQVRTGRPYDATCVMVRDAIARGEQPDCPWCRANGFQSSEPQYLWAQDYVSPTGHQPWAHKPANVAVLVWESCGLNKKGKPNHYVYVYHDAR
jgi:hypothetical protein